MLKNYIKIALRNILKSKMISFINIAGLAIGLTIVMVIFLNVQQQFSYDKFHDKHERIYLTKIGEYYATPAAFADYVSQNVPGIQGFVRFEDWEGRKVILNYTDKSLIVRNIIFTDPSVFDVFSFKFIYGDANNSLSDPYSLVLCESESKKLFGSENPIGKVVRFNNEYDYTITGVIEDTPANSSFVYGGFAAFRDRSQFAQNWNGNYYQTYFLIDKKQNASVIESNIKTVITEFLVSKGVKNAETQYPVRLLSLNDLYFSNESPENYRRGSIQSVYIFIAIGFFILFLAALNYINLTMASSITRMKEIAIRRTIGSNKSQLIIQFLFESLLTSMLATLIGIILLELSLPLFNNLFSTSMVFEPANSLMLILLVLGSALLVGIITGVFPALYLTSINTVNAIKGAGVRIGNRFNLRKLLITFQFSISIILLMATFVIMKQREFIKTMDIGFNKEQIVWFDLNSSIEKNKDAFREMLLNNPDVINVSYTRFNEADANNMWTDKYEDRDISVHPFWIDENYISTMGIKIIDGRNFSNEFAADREGAIILNQAAIREFDMKSPIGKKVFGRTIIGIVNDFNYQSLHHKVEPLGLVNLPGVNKANIKLSGINIAETLSYIEEQWKELSPGYPFEYHFLDDSYQKLYDNEKKTGMMINFFSFLALFIACLGLYGMTSFSIKQRTKEIGIRKVVGAGVLSVLTVISKDFVKWIVAANIIAFPVANFAMSKWLDDFAYKTEISWWVFVLSGGIALLIALATVSYQAIKAATANPIKSLKYE